MGYDIYIENNEKVVENVTFSFNFYSLKEYLYLPDLNKMSSNSIATILKNTLECLWDEEYELIPLDTVTENQAFGSGNLENKMKIGIFMAHLERLFKVALEFPNTIWHIES